MCVSVCATTADGQMQALAAARRAVTSPDGEITVSYDVPRGMLVNADCHPKVGPMPDRPGTIAGPIFDRSGPEEGPHMRRGGISA